MSQGLLDGFLPESIIDTVKGPSGKNIKYILFPYVGNTYYMCVVERTSTGYMMKVDKLNDNFQRILSRCTVSALPGWLERSDPELYFEVSGSVITIQHEASGKNMGIAYLDNQGNVKFKPQI
jgi:hypothetical protein